MTTATESLNVATARKMYAAVPAGDAETVMANIHADIEVTYCGTPPDVSAAGRLELARCLERAGLLDASRLTVTDAHLNPVAYILYDLDFESKRDTVLAALDALEGFWTLGRFGRYEYHNSDQCLARAMDLHARMAPALAAGGAARRA